MISAIFCALASEMCAACAMLANVSANEKNEATRKHSMCFRISSGSVKLSLQRLAARARYASMPWSRSTASTAFWTLKEAEGWDRRDEAIRARRQATMASMGLSGSRLKAARWSGSASIWRSRLRETLRIAPVGVLISCATPATRTPSVAIFSFVTSWLWAFLRSS